MFGPAAFPAKTSATPAPTVVVSPESDQASSSVLSNWYETILIALPGSSSKTFRASLAVTKGQTSQPSSVRWMNSGILWRGECLMLSTLEHLSVVEECSLSQVIQTTAPQECFLGPAHLEKWLHRAELRAPNLDPLLKRAFRNQISSLSNTQQSAESHIGPVLKERATAMTAKPTPLTRGEAPTWSVRRMMASEYEKLQGFDQNWTALDLEPAETPST